MTLKKAVQFGLAVVLASSIVIAQLVADGSQFKQDQTNSASSLHLADSEGSSGGGTGGG